MPATGYRLVYLPSIPDTSAEPSPTMSITVSKYHGGGTAGPPPVFGRLISAATLMQPRLMSDHFFRTSSEDRSAKPQADTASAISVQMPFFRLCVNVAENFPIKRAPLAAYLLNNTCSSVSEKLGFRSRFVGVALAASIIVFDYSYSISLN